ncbi:MAG: RNA polymerase sigma factor [Lachnospiraceae bacterium]|nr:RNA polymerase sigma factor [Lachnospiraceae bacterium]
MDVDFLLIQRMRMGDEKAIDQFIEKYYPKIYKYCRMHMYDTYISEDMTQETFIRFFDSLGKYQHWGKAANYLYVIASNVCKDFYRKTKEIPLDAFGEEHVCFEVQTDLRLDIQSAFDKLPDDIREVSILFFIQEQKQKDIAKIMGIGLPLVKYRISRAREILTEFLREEDI